MSIMPFSFHFSFFSLFFFPLLFIFLIFFLFPLPLRFLSLSLSSPSLFPYLPEAARWTPPRLPCRSATGFPHARRRTTTRSLPASSAPARDAPHIHSVTAPPRLPPPDSATPRRRRPPPPVFATSRRPDRAPATRIEHPPATSSSRARAGLRLRRLLLSSSAPIHCVAGPHPPSPLPLPPSQLAAGNNSATVMPFFPRARNRRAPMDPTGGRAGNRRGGAGGAARELQKPAPPPGPSAPESTFPGGFQQGAVSRASWVGLQQKTAPASEPELYQTDPNYRELIVSTVLSTGEGS
jgi:hypothetical protein